MVKNYLSRRRSTQPFGITQNNPTTSAFTWSKARNETSMATASHVLWRADLLSKPDVSPFTPVTLSCKNQANGPSQSEPPSLASQPPHLHTADHVLEGPEGGRMSGEDTNR